MNVTLTGIQRIRPYSNEYDTDRTWGSPSYFLTFQLIGCKAPLQDVIDSIESIQGVAVERCSLDDGKFILIVESDDDWRRVVEAVDKILRTLPAQAPPAPRPAPPQKFESLLEVDALEIELGYRLIPLVDSSKGGDMLERISLIRKQFAIDLGIILPPVRIRDNMQLAANDYLIRLRGNIVAKGVVYPDHLLAMNTGGVTGPIANAVAVSEPAFGLPAHWIASERRDEAERLEYVVVTPSDVLTTHLTEFFRSHADELLTLQETMTLVSHLHERAPALVEEIVPAKIKGAQLQKVLRKLLRERVPIRDLETILEALGDGVEAGLNIDQLTATARVALSRTICGQFADEKGRLWSLLLDPELEKLIDANRSGDPDGKSIFRPHSTEQIIEQITARTKEPSNGGKQHAIVCQATIREPLRRAIERELPSLPVLAFTELIPGVHVEVVGWISPPRS